MVLEARTAPVVSCRAKSGQPLSAHVPAVVLVRVTLAVIVPAAPSPSLNTPVKSLPVQVDPSVVVDTPVVVVVVLVVLDVVVVVDLESIACRLTATITTRAAKSASSFRVRLTD
jgi:hypothetical protein